MWLLRALETVAAGVAAAIPVLVAGANAVHDHWQPAADQAIIVTRAYDVFSGHGPQFGQYSLAGINGHLIHSPGPMLYWLLAIPARFGDTASIVWTITAVNALCIVGCVALARRRGGRVLMFATAVAIALMCQSLAGEVMHDVWNPSAALFPLTLLIFLCWSVACGDYWLLPLTAVVASFTAQAHLTYVPPTGALLLVGLTGLAIWRFARWRATRSATAQLGWWRRRWARRAVAPWALAALILAALCWAPPVLDQIDNHPGNLGLLYDTATSNRPTVGTAIGTHAVVRAVGVRPWWLYVPGTRWDRKYDVRATPGTEAVDTTLALLAALALAGVAGLWRRRDLTAAALIGLLLCVALAEVAAHTPTPRVQAATLGYTTWWGSQLGMWIWLIVAWSLWLALAWGVRLLAPRARGLLAGWPARRLAVGAAVTSVAFGLVGVGGAAATGAVVSGTEKPDEHTDIYRPIQQITARVNQLIPRGSSVLLLGDLDISSLGIKPAMRYFLVRHDVRPLANGSYLRLGTWYEQSNRPYQYVIFVGWRPRPPRDLPAVGVRRVIHLAYYDPMFGAQTVSVWVGRPKPGTGGQPVGCAGGSSCPAGRARRGPRPAPRARVSAHRAGRVHTAAG